MACSTSLCAPEPWRFLIRGGACAPARSTGAAARWRSSRFAGVSTSARVASSWLNSTIFDSKPRCVSDAGPYALCPTCDVKALCPMPSARRPTSRPYTLCPTTCDVRRLCPLPDARRQALCPARRPTSEALPSADDVRRRGPMPSPDDVRRQSPMPYALCPTCDVRGPMPSARRRATSEALCPLPDI